MPTSLNDSEWDLLVHRINDEKCTPFLGAGAAYGVLPLGAEIAQGWAGEFGYPLEDDSNLTRVATYLAVQRDSMYPKELLLRTWFVNPKPPNFEDPGEPHAALAELPIPIYMTTNYDSFMMQALHAAGKTPHRELCHWNNFTKELPSVFDDPHGFEPTPKEPVVFHLHGHDEYAESLVLTEDDYLDFLVSVSKEPELLPHHVRRRLTGTSLLFIGYSLADWNFRTLFRGLINSMEQTLRRISVTVQVPPKTDRDASASSQANGDFPASSQADGDVSSSPQTDLQTYLSNYYDKIDIHVYWGKATDFVQELRGRWEDFKKSNG